jgi:hypothetical protein
MINILNLSATLVKFSNGIEIQNEKQQHENTHSTWHEGLRLIASLHQ